MENKTAVVSFASIKGGVGKTSVAIKLADCCAGAGKRVLMIDSDLNNSLSFHYLDEEMMRKTDKLNFAFALGDENNNLCDFAVPTKTPGVDLIASSAYLSDLRTLSERRLKRMVPSVNGRYDILIIDCHPTYDNIVLNALHAAEYVITPVLKDTFSYNAAMFFASVLPRDVENLRNWFVLLNGYDARFENAKGGKQNDFLSLYGKSKLPLMPRETWIPWTQALLASVDYGRKIAGKEGVAGAAAHPALYRAIAELAGCFFDGELDIPEAF